VYCFFIGGLPSSQIHGSQCTVLLRRCVSARLCHRTTSPSIGPLPAVCVHLHYLVDFL
jgi:hypothetical protein